MVPLVLVDCERTNGEPKWLMAGYCGTLISIKVQNNLFISAYRLSAS